jgi:glyoxylase-like metal-dependent hydrolase (beta-lactamase superfamily II)
MRIHAEPQSVVAPLQGGQDGATVVVEPMIGGHVLWPNEAMEKDSGALWRLKALGLMAEKKPVPCPSFLVRHPTAGNVLIDTALHPSVASDPRHSFGTMGARALPPRLETGEDIPSQLRAKGIDHRQIRAVVMTHLHMDHASGMSEFPESTFIFSEAEWVDATAGSRPLMRGYKPSHYDLLFDYLTVDFESEDEEAPIDSYGSFARTFDLFGDGSIRLAYTPGHSAGHMSVILRLPRRDFVVGGDLMYTFRQLVGGPPQPRPYDDHNWRRSLKEMQLFHREYPYAVITPGHDVDFYDKLEDRYAE